MTRRRQHDRAPHEPLAAAWEPLLGRARKHSSVRRPRGWLGSLRPRRGWRGYALAVLVALTLVAAFDAGRNLGADQSEAGGATMQVPLIPNPMPDSRFAADKPSAELPDGGRFTVRGAGTWSVVDGAGKKFGTGRVYTYTVEVENGVRLAGGPHGFATTVDSTLQNPKSWIGSGRYAFRRVEDPAAADIRISLTSQQTTRQLCGFEVPYDSSCWSAADMRVVINTARWARGALAFEGNVVAYQQYVVNHEVGHALGFSHLPCPRDGALAPVMMQQTWGLSNDYLSELGADTKRADGAVCEPNAWPFPTGG